MIDWTISFGNILTIITIVAGSLAAFFSVKGDVRVIKHDMENVKQQQIVIGEAFSQITQVLIKLATQETRLNGLEEDFRELRRGKGFIKDP